MEIKFLIEEERPLIMISDTQKIVIWVHSTFPQACRGRELDSGTEVADAIGDMEAMDDKVEMRRIPTEADFLMAYSVVPGELYVKI